MNLILGLTAVGTIANYKTASDEDLANVQAEFNSIFGSSYVRTVADIADADYTAFKEAFAHRYAAWDDGSSVLSLDTVLPAYVELITDAESTITPYDSIPDIAADGVDSCTLTISAKAADGTTATGFTGAFILDTTGGNLSSRRVVAVDGVATVTLTSGYETKLANITARIEDNNIVRMGRLVMQIG